MAIETVRRRVCDMCGEKEDVIRVRIQLIDGTTKTSTVDLCAEHRKPILEAMASKTGKGKPVRRVVSKKSAVKKRR